MIDFRFVICVMKSVEIVNLSVLFDPLRRRRDDLFMVQFSRKSIGFGVLFNPLRRPRVFIVKLLRKIIGFDVTTCVF